MASSIRKRGLERWILAFASIFLLGNVVLVIKLAASSSLVVVTTFEEPPYSYSPVPISDIIINDLLFVTGYWKLERNAKRSVRYYQKSINKTLDYLESIQAHVIYFHNNNPKSTRTKRHIKFIYKPTSQLLFEQAKGLIRMCQRQKKGLLPHEDKATRHYSRMKASGAETWTQVVAIWISKLALLRDIIQQHQHNYFAWIDAGLYERIPNSLPTLLNQTIDNRVVWFRPSPMTFNHASVPVRAGIMIGHRQPLLRFIDAYLTTLESILQSNEPLCYCEEAIFTQMRISPGFLDLPD